MFIAHLPAGYLLTDRLTRQRGLYGVALAALLLHMALDSVVAEIAWLAPFSDRTFG
ncbi:hypothetical protein [Falsirhodobacter sp. 20TX0035]|uniref:hypothetical protein n=1 Tax=Falsirhodobacter sp. 20TX0035 TaxID=3022019 RepID=UPI00232F59A4|nr:hypothetical protein [Falsirhodobacter sp. 20TX0035]MDB6452144.1 hypothetical protein [Falsirhodobacter sp. 20TX0035]